MIDPEYNRLPVLGEDRLERHIDGLGDGLDDNLEARRHSRLEHRIGLVDVNNDLESLDARSAVRLLADRSDRGDNPVERSLGERIQLNIHFLPFLDLADIDFVYVSRHLHPGKVGKADHRHAGPDLIGDGHLSTRSPVHLVDR